jgi:outer membrane protein OmpA-like peptidoglycan-associated protein
LATIAPIAWGKQASAQGAAKEFVLYFDSGRSAIENADQKAVLDSVVAYAKSSGIKQMTVTGHTDTAEANAQALSLARANAVVAGVKSRGLPASVKIMSVTGAGSSDPAVAPKPATPEQLNRRVAVDLGIMP